MSEKAVCPHPALRCGYLVHNARGDWGITSAAERNATSGSKKATLSETYNNYKQF